MRGRVGTPHPATGGRSPRRRWAVVSLLAATACAGVAQVAKVVAQGESRTLRSRPSAEARGSPGKPGLLILAIDGVGRDLLYSLLAKGALPELATLLGEEHGKFPHAYFAQDVLSTLPSTTGFAWATLFPGVAPAEHGFMGNEFFVRETKEFAAPIPVSVSGADEALSVFTEGYANRFLGAPTIYETMRQRDPSVDIWVSMSQFYAGADRYFMTRRSTIGVALEAFLTGHTHENLPWKVWADLDQEDVEVVVDWLGREPVPDVLTLYLFGTDNWAHVAPEGPDVARTNYLREVVDPSLGALRRRLAERDALRNRYVVVVSDHGHTAVMKDDAHALSTKDDNDPPAVLRRAGYRVRPFEAKVSDGDAFQAVPRLPGCRCVRVPR